MCEMAWKIVCARHDKQKERFLADREKAVSSAAKKQSKARIATGLKGKGDALALRGLCHRSANKGGGNSLRSTFRNEVGGEGEDEEGNEYEEEERDEEEEEEEEEDGDGEDEDEDGGSTVSSLGASSSSSRGKRKRKELEKDQAARAAALMKRQKEDEKKKKKADPLVEMVDLLKKGEERQARSGDDDAIVRFLERMDAKDKREEEERKRKEKREEEDHNMEQLMKLQKHMLENNLTVATLPPLMKRRWEKLNSAGDDEE